MPYRWTEIAETRQLVAQPHQSMTPRGFVWFMGSTLILVAMPLIAVVGTPVLWGLLPFVAGAIWGVWRAIERNRSDAALTETLTIRADDVELVRRDGRGREKRWNANPYWVSVHLHAGERPVEHYLTLKGGGREVELGAFLSPEERVALKADVAAELARTRQASQ